MASPEELARENIDKLLTECGWIIQNRSTINLSAARGIAVREALLKGGDEVDYLLFVDGKAIGTVEAKAGRLHAHRRRRAIRQIRQRSARHLSEMAGSAAVRLRIDRRRNAIHQPARSITEKPQRLRLS